MFFIIVVINYWTKINLFSIFVDYQLPLILIYEKTPLITFVGIFHLLTE